MKGYRAFANKVWNAARFVLMNLRDEDSFVVPEEIDELIKQKKEEVPLEDLWILHRLNQVSAEISDSLEKFRFHEASAVIYQFIWHELCDWYIELVKPVLTNPSVPEAERSPRIKVLVHILDSALRLLHPFMPFVTEEIWQNIPHRGDFIMNQEFPSARKVRENFEAAQKMEDLMNLVGEIRSLRAEMNIDPKRALEAVLIMSSAADRDLVSQNLQKVKSLARLNKVEFSDSASGSFLRGVWRLGEFGLDVHDALNLAAERERMQKEIGRGMEEIGKVRKKLDNPDFLSRAREDVVSETRSRYDELLERQRKLELNFKRLPLN
jgi:valyl-tRNA synthetase